MNHRIHPHIHTPEDLGNAHLGSPHSSIVPPKYPIDRAEYGKKLAELQSGIFTPFGYFVPNKNTRRKHHAE